MGIDTKEKLLDGTLTRDKKSFVGIPLENNSPLGISREPLLNSQRLEISGKEPESLLEKDFNRIRTDRELVVDRLSVSLLAVWKGVASAEFPTSATAHPSHMIQVYKIEGQDFEYPLPIFVERELWILLDEVWKDPNLSQDSKLNQDQSRKDPAGFLERIRERVREVLKKNFKIPG